MRQEPRVVITGLGVVAPNGSNLLEFNDSLKKGKSGIEYQPELERLQFSCQIAGVPKLDPQVTETYLTALERRSFNSNGILHGLIAGIDAWLDAGFSYDRQGAEPNYDSGTVFGTGTSGIDKFRESIYKVDNLDLRRLGSTVVLQTMASGVSAMLAGKLGLGNQVTTNSSACATGVESVLSGYERIRNGQALRMLCGSTTDSGPYIWAGFDAMKVCTYKHNHTPELGSRPMSASASGFVPGGGAGALVLENLASARSRGAKIYAELLGGELNCGAQRNGGSMTAQNAAAVIRCIERALSAARVNASSVDLIGGHLTATRKDAQEVAGWCTALGRSGKNFPYINSLKSMTGHCLSASGSIELVASVLQLHQGFVFPNINCEDLHPEIERLIDPSCIPQKVVDHPFGVTVKASFGFGDVNGVLVLKRYDE